MNEEYKRTFKEIGKTFFAGCGVYGFSTAFIGLKQNSILLTAFLVIGGFACMHIAVNGKLFLSQS